MWFFANCDLCITTGCGPDMFSDVFRRPILALNFLPLQNLWSWSNALHYPKTLRWQKSQRLLSSNEYLTHAYYASEEYCCAGIDIQDLTEAQIFEAVREAGRELMVLGCQIAMILNCSKSSRMYLFLTRFRSIPWIYPFRGSACFRFP